MKIIYIKSILPKSFYAINIFGVIFANKQYGKLSETEVNHEKIHSWQIIELLGIFFYIFYVVEWLFRLIQYRSFMKAYYNISFEREAYKNMHDLDYLKKRKLFSFIHYYKIR